MRNSTLACVVGAATLGGALFASAPATAQSLACGGTYTIQRGDTLQKVTRMAYGEGLSFNFLYRANRDVVGPNPSLIEVGMVLQIPCRDGQTAGAAAPAPAPTAASSTASASESASTVTGESAASSASTTSAPRVQAASLSGIPNRRPFRFITGTDWAPFTNADQAEGGMITDIMRTALSTVAAEDEYQIDYVRDWNAHLQPLLSDVAYDFSIPWFRPNCDKIDLLGENSRLRCQELKFSDPLFEMITSYYVNANSGFAPTTPTDLIGKRVCRAASYATFMLEEFDVRPPAIEYVRPTLWRDCFEALARNEVDILYISSTAAEALISELGLEGQIVEVPELAYITTMHAVTSVNNPRADDQIAVINEGIANVRESGKWFEIVQRHLVAHARRTSN